MGTRPKQLKSGLMVLVDLFSLLSITMFAIYVISRDDASQDKKMSASNILSIQITFDFGNDATNAMGRNPDFDELIEPDIWLLDSEGKRINSSLARSRDKNGVRITYYGAKEARKAIIRLGKVLHPVAFAFPVRVNVSQLSPVMKSYRETLNVGDWRDISLAVSQ